MSKTEFENARYFKSHESRGAVTEYLDHLFKDAVKKRYQNLYDMNANSIWRRHVVNPPRHPKSINDEFPDISHLWHYFPRGALYAIAQKGEDTYIRIDSGWNGLLKWMDSPPLPYAAIPKNESAESDLFQPYNHDVLSWFREYGHMHFVKNLEAQSPLAIARYLLVSEMEDHANNMGNPEWTRKIMNAVENLPPKVFELKKSTLRSFTMQDFFVQMDAGVHYELPPNLARETLVSLILRED